MAITTTLNTRLSPLPPVTGRAGLRGAIASEFTKIRSVRSTYWTLAALLVVSIGVGAAITGGAEANFSHNLANKAGFDATQTSLIAFFEIGQLIIAVIAALAITSEYSTGMIRTSLTAEPRRGAVYAAKAIVLTSLTLVVSLVTSFIAFFVGQALLSSSGVSASLFHTVRIPQNANINCPPNSGNSGGPGGVPPGCKLVFSGTDVIHPSTVLLAIIGCALFVTLVAILAFGIGAIVRHTAGTIAIAIAALFIIPVLEQALPNTWRWDIMRFLPDAANQVVSVTLGDNNINPHLWSAWPQLGVTALWAAALAAVGAYLFRKRDA
jgi:ABC-type transport system involved in multi-copper enzyme maturation permease subunit